MNDDFIRQIEKLRLEIEELKTQEKRRRKEIVFYATQTSTSAPVITLIKSDYQGLVLTGSRLFAGGFEISFSSAVLDAATYGVSIANAATYTDARLPRFISSNISSSTIFYIWSADKAGALADGFVGYFTLVNYA